MLALTLLSGAACSSGGPGGGDASDPCAEYCVRLGEHCAVGYLGGSEADCLESCRYYAAESAEAAHYCSAEHAAMHACLGAHPIECNFGTMYGDPNNSLDYACRAEFVVWSECLVG